MVNNLVDDIVEAVHSAGPHRDGSPLGNARVHSEHFIGLEICPDKGCRLLKGYLGGYFKCYRPCFNQCVTRLTRKAG